VLKNRIAGLILGAEGNMVSGNSEFMNSALGKAAA